MVVSCSPALPLSCGGYIIHAFRSRKKCLHRTMLSGIDYRIFFGKMHANEIRQAPLRPSFYNLQIITEIKSKLTQEICPSGQKIIVSESFDMLLYSFCIYFKRHGSTFFGFIGADLPRVGPSIMTRVCRLKIGSRRVV